MEARAKIEEDLFTRVPLSKTERRRQKATSRSANNALAHVGDFGDDVATSSRRRRSWRDARGKARGRRLRGAEARKAPKPVRGEEDVPLRDSLGVRSTARDEPHDDSVFRRRIRRDVLVSLSHHSKRR